MKVNGELIPIVPSPAFVERGKHWKFGNPIPLQVRDLEERIPKEISATVGGEWKYSGLSFESYGDAKDDLWYVLVFYEKGDDVYIVLFNMKGEMWPLGRSYDPFEDDPFEKERKEEDH